MKQSKLEGGLDKQSVEAQDAALPVMGSDQLAHRVLAMVDSPPAWLGKRLRIDRLETDGEREWGRSDGQACGDSRAADGLRRGGSSDTAVGCTMRLGASGQLFEVCGQI